MQELSTCIINQLTRDGIGKDKAQTRIDLKTKTKGLMLARSMWTAGELITGASYSVINKRHHPLVDSGSDEQHSKGQRQPTAHTFTTPCAIINAVNVITGSGGRAKMFV